MLLTGTVVAGALVVCLVGARVIFIPLALAILITFLLSPIVIGLQRWGISRLLAVITAVIGAGLLLGGMFWLLTRQVNSLLAELPVYTTQIKTKVEWLQAFARDSTVHGLEEMVTEIGKSLNRRPENPGSSKPNALNELNQESPEKPVPVVVQENDFASISYWTGYLGSAGEIVGGAGLAGVLAVFMLLRREDLRNRFVRLLGLGHITVTTKAVDEAGQRISRYLLMQAVVNGCYGLALAAGLFAIGVKYALLWGFLAGMLRYIPYIGTWLASLFPITMSLAMFDGWLHTMLVIGIIILLEVAAYTVIEPRVYRHSMGVSEVALLLSAAFWTFLWGPVGLVLANPMTVCLVVLGRYIPQLDFLEVLLGDEPVMEPAMLFYQRLLARDQDEAADIVLNESTAGSADSAYDNLLIPALNYAQRDRERDALTDLDEDFILNAVREIVEDLSDRRSNRDDEAAKGHAADSPRVRILCCPARLPSDRIALEMLEQLFDPAKYNIEITGEGMLTAELVAYVARLEPRIVCIAALPPGGLSHTRYLCKRLRGRFPELKIMVGRWGLKTNVEQNVERLQEAGADQVATTLLKTREQVNAWYPVLWQENADCLSQT
jgi:predicted PurR-regulated permease PerM